MGFEGIGCVYVWDWDVVLLLGEEVGDNNSL